MAEDEQTFLKHGNCRNHNCFHIALKTKHGQTKVYSLISVIQSLHKQHQLNQNLKERLRDWSMICVCVCVGGGIQLPVSGYPFRKSEDGSTPCGAPVEPLIYWERDLFVVATERYRPALYYLRDMLYANITCLFALLYLYLHCTCLQSFLIFE